MFKQLQIILYFLPNQSNLTGILAKTRKEVLQIAIMNVRLIAQNFAHEVEKNEPIVLLDIL
jgi:hypothetical protein